MKLIPLQEQYQNCIKEFKRTGYRPHLSALLALLLFQEIDKYKTFICADDEFYDYHKISEKVKQVIKDFSVTKEDIRSYDEDTILIEVLSDDSYYYEIGYSIFASGWCSLKNAIMRDDNNLSPEELFLEYANINGWMITPPKKYNLKELYEQYKKDFNRTGLHPHPAELLALLLLPEKEKYPAISGNSGEFYRYYKEAINEKIEQVIVDFAISKKEIIDYIEKNGKKDEDGNYEMQKIWYVFSQGFGVVQWGNMYHPNATPEKIHNDFSYHWGREPLLENQVKETKPKTRKRGKNEIQHLVTKFKY